MPDHRSRGRTALGAVSLGVAAAGAALAFGGSAAAGPPTAGSAATVLKLRAASSGNRFNRTSLSARAGAVTIRMKNPSGADAEHAVAISGGGVNRSGKVVDPDGSSTVKARLKKGSYAYFCPVADHRKTMKGRLKVS
jgi:plastocyanin